MWNTRGRLQEVEYKRWITRGGTPDVENKQGIQEVEYKRLNTRFNGRMGEDIQTNDEWERVVTEQLKTFAPHHADTTRQEKHFLFALVATA